ncbi:MAG: HAMP domain-containing histidine kinase [Clostridiales Family XIII bacterium]|jgi:signal transduction histidine kinase|nr:HAMP domain-containing histidine kinase [Clostridiales Family XIII bacterium]
MSIKGKIFICLLIFCAALLALLWLFQVVFLDSIYKAVKTGEVKAVMKTLTADLDSSDLFDVAADLSEQKNVSIEILSENGSTLYSSGRDDFLRQREPINEISRLFILTMENGGEYFERPFQVEGQALQIDEILQRSGPQPRSPISRQQMIYSCKFVMRPSGGVFIVLAATISPVDATVGTLRMELYFVTGFMLLFSLFLALLIARYVSKPIVSINESAKKLAAGRYDAVFAAKGYKEITELSDTLNIAARELSISDELQKELIANISHDLRTPLTLIAGYAEAMRDLPGEDTPENAQIIIDEAKRLNRLVGDVLDLSKLRSGASEMKPAPYNLTESLREITFRFAEFTKAEGYHILFEAAEDICVTADESGISQAVCNLLGNAIDFTGPDKTVTLRQIVAPYSVTVEVADTGRGVEPEELPHIWDRYYRTGKKHRRAAVGTGIGLSIVKSIMEAHGGAYGAESEPWKGSVFWIRLKR